MRHGRLGFVIPDTCHPGVPLAVLGARFGCSTKPATVGNNQ